MQAKQIFATLSPRMRRKRLPYKSEILGMKMEKIAHPMKYEDVMKLICKSVAHSRLY